MKTRALRTGGAAVETPACLQAAAESPSEPWEAIDWTTTDQLLRDLRVGACIVLVFQLAYLAADQGRSRPETILTLHIFNLLTTVIFLGLAHLRAYADRIPHLIFGFCALLFASTAALSILTVNRAPLTITLTITMLGVAALIPWDWRWQAGVAVAAVGSMAAMTLLRPEADLHLGYDWFAIVTAAGVAQCGALSGQRYRREIASRIMALQINHRFLRESEAKLRKIFETSSDAITINRLSDGRYLEVNEAFAGTGYSREEALAQSAGALGVWANRAQLREFMKTLRARGSVVNTEIDLRTKGGRIDPFPISAKVIELDGEECMVTIGRDIRSIKQTEADLIAAREAALAASQAKSEFLSSMSHEIRTPMNAILGMSEQLSETELDPQQQKFLGIMQNNGNILLELINDILDLAKIESGRLSLEQTTFQLEGLLDKIVESLAARAHGKGLELIARAVPETPQNLVGDPLRLRQILINLLGNAIKFTEIGEIVLTVERDCESSEPGRLHFRVADTGVGIPASRLDHVFESFTQVDASTTRQYGGSGLGLAIVKRLVELMGGRLWVESEVGILRQSLRSTTPNVGCQRFYRRWPGCGP
jgi:PAS domain S-box-containing protein